MRVPGVAGFEVVLGHCLSPAQEAAVGRQCGDAAWLCIPVRDCHARYRELREQGIVPPSSLFSAVCRNLEIIGEASRKVPPDFRAANPEVPWREMNDLRNVLIHNYEGADPDLVWAIVDRDIPPCACQKRVTCRDECREIRHGGTSNQAPCTFLR